MSLSRSLSLTLALAALLGGTAFAAGPSQATRDQIKALLLQYRQQADAYRQQIQMAEADYLAKIEATLALTPAQLDAIEDQLEAAEEAAETRLEALPEADQTLANLRTILLEELKKVTDAATADAGQRAALDAASVAYVDAVLPLKDTLSKLRADTRAQIKALRKP